MGIGMVLVIFLDFNLENVERYLRKAKMKLKSTTVFNKRRYLAQNIMVAFCRVQSDEFAHKK